MVPTLSLLLMIPATLLLFGPIGIYLGDGVNWLYYYIINFSPILLGGFIGGISCVLVIFGAHRGLVPIGINDVAQQDGKNSSVCWCSELFSSGRRISVFCPHKK